MRSFNKCSSASAASLACPACRLSVSLSLGLWRWCHHPCIISLEADRRDVSLPAVAQERCVRAGIGVRPSSESLDSSILSRKLFNNASVCWGFSSKCYRPSSAKGCLGNCQNPHGFWVTVLEMFKSDKFRTDVLTACFGSCLHDISKMKGK